MTEIEVEVPEDIAPMSMKRNGQGRVVGHLFQLTPEGVRQLSAWFTEELDGHLDNALARLDIGGISVSDLKNAIAESLEDLRDASSAGPKRECRCIMKGGTWLSWRSVIT
jgi:hypothetical protein